MVIEVPGRREAGSAGILSGCALPRKSTLRSDVRNRLLRFVRLEDGKVTAVETGSYGYAE